MEREPLATSISALMGIVRMDSGLALTRSAKRGVDG